jgi:hypothetical protein
MVDNQDTFEIERVTDLSVIVDTFSQPNLQQLIN